MRELLWVVPDEIFLLIQGSVLENKPAFRVDCPGRRPMGCIGEKVLQGQPALVGERKQPATKSSISRLGTGKSGKHQPKNSSKHD